ncbi:MAG: hypothetical protein WB949_04230, partial [Candidatus Acidiferrales bacterium]
MKPMLALTVMMMLSMASAAAQSTTNATTTDGKKVILSKDGTWKYASAADASQPAAALTYEKPSTASAVLVLNKGAASFSYDASKWTPSKQDDADKTEWHHTSGDLYGLIISERLETSPEALKAVALKNLKAAASSFTVLQEEKRLVNGSQVTYLEFEAVVSDVTFIWEGYYYAGPAGTIQVVT